MTDNVGANERDDEQKNKGKCESRCNSKEAVNFTLDSISMADFCSDVFMTKVFFVSRHTFWFSISFITMLLPFILAYIPFVQLKLEKLRRKGRDLTYY